MSTAVSPAHEAPAHCANCEMPVSGNYCSHCGQEAVLHHASTREFLHEFIGHYVALEGKLWGTLSRLVFRPGALTNEYIRGRRVRFVQPLRLYLTLSVLFFALLKFGGYHSSLADDYTDEPPAVQATAADKSAQEAAKPAAAAPAKEGAERKMAQDDIGKWLGDHQLDLLRKKWYALGAMSSDQQKEALQEGFYHYAPYAIFCLMPVFALYLKLLYLGRGRRFGEHVLFALHTNAFAFLIFSLMLVIPVGIVDFALWCWLLAYLPWAMRRVYHGSRKGAIVRWLVLMFFYMISVAIALALAGAMGAMTAGH